MSRSRSSSMASLSHGCGLIDDGIHLLGNILHRVEPRASAYAVDGLEATGRYEPRARIRRDAVARPLLERRSESVVQRLLGEVEVAEQTDQRGEHAARFGTIDGVGHLTHVLGCLRLLGVRLSSSASMVVGRSGRCSNDPAQTRFNIECELAISSAITAIISATNLRVIIDTGRVFENTTRGLVSINGRNGRMTSCG